MCLYSKNRLPRIAWKPIKVYKIVVGENNTFYTPSMHYKLKNRNLINVFTTLFNVIFNVRKFLNMYIVSAGFFHSFLNETRAVNSLNISLYLLKDIKNYGILIECTIPRFSLYYIGTDGEICSNRLNTEFKKYETEN